MAKTQLGGSQISLLKSPITGSNTTLLHDNARGLELTGSVLLKAAPTVDLEAATKKYVDDNTGGSAVSADEVVFGKSGGGFDSNEQFKLEGTQDGGKAFNAVLNTGTTGSFRASTRMFQVTGSANVEEAISLKSSAGHAASTIVLENVAGTTEGAIELTSTAGGVDINAADGKDVAINGGQVLLTSAHDVANSIYVHANAGTSETIKIHSDQGSGAGSIELTSDAGGIDVNAAGAISLDSSAGSIDVNVVDGQTVSVGLNGAVETIWTPSATAGTEAWSTINTSGDTDGTDAAGAILLSAVAGGIGLAWADDKDLWMEGGRAVVTANEDAADAIKLHADAGSSQTITVVNDAGTSEAAIALTSTAGGVDIDAAAAKDVNIAGGQVALVSKTAEAGAISLTTAIGAAETITVTNTEGTTDATDGAGAILLDATAGGISLAWADTMDLWAEGGQFVVTANHDTAEAIKLHADAGTSQTIQIINDAGTVDGTAGAGAIDIEATAGGISMLWADGKDLWMEGGRAVVTANEDAADAIKLHADAGTSQTITLLNDAGTAAGAVLLQADAGGIMASAATDLLMSAQEMVSLSAVTTLSLSGSSAQIFGGASGLSVGVGANTLFAATPSAGSGAPASVSIQPNTAWAFNDATVLTLPSYFQNSGSYTGDGAETSFNSSATAVQESIKVFLNGVRQEVSQTGTAKDYSLGASHAVVFGTAPVQDDVVIVEWRSTQ
jgi:hypothetical protein